MVVLSGAVSSGRGPHGERRVEEPTGSATDSAENLWERRRARAASAKPAGQAGRAAGWRR
ncbi:hypothetical protein HMPREF1549_00974 [Actinomyces johnsonii F0510]|uniref:Uncharacterized protein n=1 Tax=Actinomyces johnsonii F0510 TaxID=1227262 RepID=U1QF25_9ACTO|nr:hypothetical protein HMPREF1549_00974 [Actinomyces johnsonii F0510]